MTTLTAVTDEMVEALVDHLAQNGYEARLQPNGVGRDFLAFTTSDPLFGLMFEIGRFCGEREDWLGPAVVGGLCRPSSKNLGTYSVLYFPHLTLGVECPCCDGQYTGIEH